MNASWKTMWLAAVPTAWLAVAAGPRKTPSSDERTLTVGVWDYAGVSEKSLDEMETLSALLLYRAGLRTQWVHCLGHSHSLRPALCDANLVKGSVMLRILVAYPGNQNQLGDPLGTAVVESGYASIYSREIRKCARHNGLLDGSLMAYAATHEIGHLLLGANHSLAGIMLAVWREPEYRAMDQRWLGFGSTEQQALRQAVPIQGPRLAKLK